MICVDSYGWIERLTGGPKASKYNAVIDRTHPEKIITPTVVLYEVYRKIKRLKGEETALEAVASLSQTNVIPIDQTLSLEAADYSIEYNLHMSDALVFAVARHYGAELYTSDQDLRSLKFVTFM